MSMNRYYRYTLPTTVEVDGAQYPIRTDYRAVLNVLSALNDPELDDTAKYYVLRDIMFPEWDKIPEEHRDRALAEAADFIDYMPRGEGKKSLPRLVDWEKDEDMIASAINLLARTEIRALEYLHWWTFLSYFMNIRESVYSTVLHIRAKRARHQKLEPWELEFYNQNRNLIDMRPNMTEEQKAELLALEKFL